MISSAIKPGNPELDEARAKGLPIVRRAEMLAELMRFEVERGCCGHARQDRRQRRWFPRFWTRAG